MSKRFEITYEVDDGFAGGARVHGIEFDLGWYCPEDLQTDKDAEIIYNDLIDDDFQQTISPYGTNFMQFLAWVKTHKKADA